MKPLTHEELNRIEKVGMVTQFMPFSDEKMEWRTIEKKALDALIAAARHSIPRPIAEAPSNCESIVRAVDEVIRIADSGGGKLPHVIWAAIDRLRAALGNQ
jgi:hypothetical protein